MNYIECKLEYSKKLTVIFNDIFLEYEESFDPIFDKSSDLIAQIEFSEKSENQILELIKKGGNKKLILKEIESIEIKLIKDIELGINKLFELHLDTSVFFYHSKVVKLINEFIYQFNDGNSYQLDSNSEIELKSFLQSNLRNISNTKQNLIIDTFNQKLGEYYA